MAVEAVAPPATAPASWYAVVGGNDCYWRVDAPARAIGGKAFLIPEEAQIKRDARGRFSGREPSGYYSLTQPNNDSMFPWTFLVDRNDPDYWEIDFPAHEGVAVWTRPDMVMSKLALAMREKLGWRTLAETDDNYLCDPRMNLFLRATHFDAQGRREHLMSCASHDGMIFSTEWLRDRYHKVLRKELGLNKQTMPELHVCRNNVDEADWPARVEREDGPVRVGWMGSPSHIWDVDLAWPAMMHARNLGCQTWMVGYDPTNPWGSMDNKMPPDVSAMASRKIGQWKKVGFGMVPWVQPSRYKRFALPLDIGLAPLLNNDFTNGKSDVKAIEYAIAGAAPILWNTQVYNRTWVHGETCLLVGGPQEALEAVELLVRDERLRARIVEAAQQYVREERGVTQMREEWTTAIAG